MVPRVCCRLLAQNCDWEVWRTFSSCNLITQALQSNKSSGHSYRVRFSTSCRNQGRGVIFFPNPFDCTQIARIMAPWIWKNAYQYNPKNTLDALTLFENF